MILCCTIDDLLLEAAFLPHTSALVVYDGDESFELEAVEALYYEVVSATPEELIRLEQAGYRLLRRAEDFAAPDAPPSEPKPARPDVDRACCRLPAP